MRTGKPNKIGFDGYFYLLSRRSRYWAITSSSALPESVGAAVTLAIKIVDFTHHEINAKFFLSN